jgi:hypothetical protein
VEVVRIVVVTLGLAVAGVLVLALAAHVTAWIRRRSVGRLHVAATRPGGQAAHGRQGPGRTS